MYINNYNRESIKNLTAKRDILIMKRSDANDLFIICSKNT